MMARVLIVQGHARSRAESCRTGDTVARLEAALARAKRAGRNRCEVA
jgi:PleD family two-component response regulator